MIAAISRRQLLQRHVQSPSMISPYQIESKQEKRYAIQLLENIAMCTFCIFIVVVCAVLVVTDTDLLEDPAVLSAPVVQVEDL